MELNIFTNELGNICLLLLSLLLLLYIVYIVFFTKESRLKSYPPGPTGLKTLKILLKGMLQDNLHEVAEVWAKEYGEVVLCRTLLGNICFLNSARVTREAFKGKNCESVTNERPKSFSGNFGFYGAKDLAFGGPSKDHWALQRKLFHSALKFYGDGIERFESAVQTELERLKERLMPRNATSEITSTEIESFLEELPDGSKEVHMNELIPYSLASVMSVLLTGECADPNAQIVSRIKNYVSVFNILLSPGNDEMLTTFPFLRFFPGFKYRRICADYLRARAEMLEEVLIKRQANRVPGFPRGITDFLQDEQGKDGNEWMTDEHVFSLLLDIIGGAVNTSLNVLLSIVILLIHHPTVMKKIQKEIDDKIGQRRLHLSDRKILQYTEAVILETLRYTSIAPLGAPHGNTDDFLLDGFCIPKNSLLMSNVWFFQRDPSIWGDPERFIPERFLDSNGNVLPTNHPFQQNFLLFGIGKRACPGETYYRDSTYYHQ